MAVRQGSLEDLVTIGPESWRERSVFVTGHTGFKGGWLALWLNELGSRVHGYALDPPTTPSLYEAAGVARAVASETIADLAETKPLTAALEQAQPEIVFHLAAQALVRRAYANPLDTFAVNVMGTAQLLEAARRIDSIRAIVVVTTDKVYANLEATEPFHEADPLGGHDPYSASKAAAELVVASYRSSWFGGSGGRGVHVATARAGNVVGGGDWAAERLVPDCVRAFSAREPVRLRQPEAVRPWQHVLEPLSGYLLLGERLLSGSGSRFSRAWNFGPDQTADASVGDVAGALARMWGSDARVSVAPADDLHEARALRLDSSDARSEIGWRPRWSLHEALKQTVLWHHAHRDGADMGKITLDQIRLYESREGA